MHRLPKRSSGLRGRSRKPRDRHRHRRADRRRLDYEALLERPPTEPLPDGDGDDLATLNFSGGTTGAPKAVMLRHRNLMTVAQNTIRGFDIGRDAVFLNVRPLWPIAQVILMSHLFAGATVVLGGRVRSGPTCRAHRASRRDAHVAGADAARALARSSRAGDARLERLQAIYVGGSRIPPAVFERALDRSWGRGSACSTA